MNLYQPKALCTVLLAYLCSAYSISDEWIITEDDLFADIDSVTGVTHLKQELQQVPAAVTIIDRRTIASSTAVDLVDLFRLVPGFQVYFHHANKPGVTYHAPGGEYSRRLEVKIDGRSVYEPLLSSVEWNTLGIDIDDIEYIEVVRGSNASADGSNAFLASINFITRSSVADFGTSLGVNYGSHGIKRGSITHLSQNGQLASKATLKMSKNDGFVNIDDSADTYTMRYQGLWTPTVSDSISFQIGMGDTETTVGPSKYFDRHWKSKYQHLEWKRITNEWSDLQFSIYHNSIDFIDEDAPITVGNVLAYWGANEDGESVDGDSVLTSATQEILMAEPNKARYIVKPSYAHYSDRWDADIRSNIYRSDDVRMSLGAASRYDSFETELYLGGPGKVSEVSNRLYANFEWMLRDDLTLNYGQVLEKRRDKESTNSYRIATNYELSKKHMFRIASSRSFREPSLLEANQRSIYTYDDIDIHIRVKADEDISKEKLISHEIGYLGSFYDKNLNLDIRIFDENLSNLIGERREPFDGETQDKINIIDNVENLELKGLEWQLQYRPSNKWMVNLNQSYIDAEGESWYGSFMPNDDVATQGVDMILSQEKVVPKQMLNLLVSYRMESGLVLSGSYHYKSAYKTNVATANALDTFSRVDIKAAKRWSLGDRYFEISLKAQNIGNDYYEHSIANLFESKYILDFRVGEN